MDIDVYQDEARKTAIYKDIISYPVLGLVDEFAEFMEKEIAFGSDFIAYSSISDNDKKEIIKEIGDFSWYIANLATDIGIRLKDLNKENVTLYCKGNHIDYDRMFIRLGKICGRVKKWMRDANRSNLSETTINLIKDNLVYFLLAVAFTAAKYDYTLEEVFQINIDKLNSRKERGVLHGDGDNR